MTLPAEGFGTIVNVNDHPPTRYNVSRILLEAGYDVLEAAHGEAALRLAQCKPDLLILNTELPDMSGLDVCRMLKSHPDTESIFILQTSTSAAKEDRVAGLESGADGYLAHPLDASELVATVRAMIRIKRTELRLRQHADELTQSHHRKDEFLAMLAHELRNPLAAISSAVPLLGRFRESPEQFQQVRGVIQRQSKHLARLIDDLLDVSGLTRGKIRIQRARCDLADLIHAAVQANRPALESRQQELELQLTALPMLLIGDAARLQQVFSNLLDNASKYSEHRGRIVVSLRETQDDGHSSAVVTVRDQGLGIRPAVLPHVFDLFVQAEDLLDRTHGGIGIGLAVVKQLVELHGGSVEVRSEGLGRGSEFEVRLPLDPDLRWSAPLPEDEMDKHPALMRKRAILVIEDNADALEMLQELLELDGHDVQIARDGATGVEMALSGQHDLGIVDIGLPGLNGYQVAERIRSEGNRGMNLIALTGYGGTDQQKRAMAAGFDRHLVKPVDPEMLLKMVAEL